MPFDLNKPAGPIPGENYTSDTRNYPWHRPPEYSDMDTAIEAIIKNLTQKDSAYALLTMLEAGVTVVMATDIYVTQGIASGKWSPDFALLLAGPISHIFKLLADGYGIKYDMGLKDEMPSTIEFLKARAALDPSKVRVVAKDVAGQADMFKLNADNQTPQQGQVGLMGSPDTQIGQLGQQKPTGGIMGMGQQDQENPQEDQSEPTEQGGM